MFIYIFDVMYVLQYSNSERLLRVKMGRGLVLVESINKAERMASL